MIISFADEKIVLDRMRAAVLASENGLTHSEMLAVLGDVREATCRRLLQQLMGRRVVTRTYEVRGTKKNGQRSMAYVFRMVRYYWR